jgi:hypothetical protein
VHSIGTVWTTNRGMPAGISRCSRLCYGWRGGLRSCHGLSQAARNVVGPGEMRSDELCTAAGVGTLGERVERAYGDWLSVAVVAIVALAVVGE